MNELDKHGDTPLITLSKKIEKNWRPGATLFCTLVEKAANIEAKSQFGQRALHFLAYRGYHPGLIELLRYNPEIDSLTDKGHTPLYIAVRKGDREGTRILLNHALGQKSKSDSSERDTLIENWTANEDGDVELTCHVASAYGNPGIISLLLKHGQFPDINLPTKYQKNTALHLANDITVLDMLVQFGADVNCLNIGQDTPLHFVARDGSTEIAELLLFKGARADVRNICGDYPWMIAARNGHRDMKDLLLKSSRNQNFQEEILDYSASRPLTSLTKTARNENLVREFELRSGNIVRGRSEIMQRAVTENNATVCGAILESGWDIEQPIGDFDVTALHWACHGQSVAVVELLITRGANLDARDKNGCYPILQAATASSSEIVELLLTAGANLRVRDKERNTPLHVAARYGSLEIVKAIAELLDSHQGLEATSNNPTLNIIEVDFPCNFSL